MKFNLADVAVDILDGLDKYPRIVIGIGSFSLGLLISSAHLGDWPVFTGAVSLLVGGLVAAWYAGRPKK